MPRPARAALSALRLADPDLQALRGLNEREWDEALAFLDRSQLTLLLGSVAAGAVPVQVRQRIDRNLRDNTERTGRVREDVFRICDALEAAQIEYVVLKGLTQWPRFVADPRLRAQYDLDLYCPPSALEPARDAVLGLGYEPVEGFERFPIDHLPTMIRKTGFEWRGNYYDPDIPVCVDIHFRFWDEDTERVRVPGLEAIWERRTWRSIDGRNIPVLHTADALAYACLHLLRHVLRGSMRLCHAYEIAYFLHTVGADLQPATTDQTVSPPAFWEEWRELHQPGLRRLESIVFLLAARWFGCELPGAVRQEIEAHSEEIRDWFERYSASPVEGLFRPNKDEVWLHLCLVDGFAERRRVLLRRLLPPRLPARGSPGNVPEAEITPRMRRQAEIRYAVHVVSRAAHHVTALAPALWAGARWWLRAGGPGSAFWRYLLTASVYHLGVFVFVLLYNLYLLDSGFREAFLGRVASLGSAGNLAGSLPAAWVAHRLGLKRTVMACAIAMAAVSAARSLVTGETALLATAFAAGGLSSLWFVSVAPAVSALTSGAKRTLGFSLFFSAGITTGVLGGVAGGRLPAWLDGLLNTGSPARAKQAALLAGCAIMAMAALPALRLALPGAPPHQSRAYPWSPFLGRLLGALAVWSFAVGVFNPFFTAYFARLLQASETRIGLVFSISQLAQAAAVLLAPLALRRFGLVGGIAGMQLAAALALACLAGGPPLLGAAALYAGYMSFQSMCEPGTYTLLMNGVAPEQRSGATAMNFLVVFGTQAVAAHVSGALIARLGYPAMLIAAAGTAVLAAAMFRLWVRPPGPEQTQTTR